MTMSHFYAKICDEDYWKCKHIFERRGEDAYGCKRFRIAEIMPCHMVGRLPDPELHTNWAEESELMLGILTALNFALCWKAVIFLT